MAFINSLVFIIYDNYVDLYFIEFIIYVTFFEYLLFNTIISLQNKIK